MNALEDARAALAMLDEHPWIDDTTASWLKIMRREAKATRDALRALISEHERIRAIAGDGLNEMARERDEARAEVARLTAPPTDDEREALAKALLSPRWSNGDFLAGITSRTVSMLVDAVLAAGFRRQRPITDAFVDRVYDSLSADVRHWLGLDDLRDAMEAARDAS
ncbi:hypothetical protein [Microbacterium sp. NPDC055455]